MRVLKSEHFHCEPRILLRRGERVELHGSKNGRENSPETADRRHFSSARSRSSPTSNGGVSQRMKLGPHYSASFEAPCATHAMVGWLESTDPAWVVAHVERGKNER